MLIPSVVAVLLWLVASGYLVFQGFYNREVANSVRNVSIPAVPALASLQQERRLSVAYLAQPSRDLQPLTEQRVQTDQRLTELRGAAKEALASAPQSITTRWQALSDQLDELPNLRATIDTRAASGSRVYDFYNGLLAAATTLFDTQARVVPDVAASLGGVTATESFRVSDQMSRAGSTIDGAFSSRSLNQQGHLEFVALVGAYRSTLTNIAPHLEPAARARYEAITASAPWKELVAAENALIAAGAWDDGIPRGLPVNRTRWESLTRQVSDELISIAVLQADGVSAEALHTGNNQLLTASLGSLLALSIAVAAILWAIRQSHILVDQALSVRLAKLGQDAAAIVDERLPAMMARLRRREKVDLAVELPGHDYGSDEIGQVAAVINRSLKAAAAAAINEAKTRAAGIAMLMGVARRPQRPLQRGLKVIEELQDRVGDEKLLTELFDINHQLTQTRRFLENLVILAGGQIGRRFQNPVPVRRVLLAAFAEAQQYQRITLRGAPDVALTGRAVAGTIHLLAELLDNALAFSPPKTTVWVTCNEVKHGVAVEIEDGGVGMNAEALETANELLAKAPTPDVAALKDGAQVGLHVVAELAKRDGIQVSLRTSAYGGLLAIVLLPERLITPDPAGAGGDRTDSDLQVPAMAGAAPARAGAGQRAPRPAAGGGFGTVTNGSTQRRDPRTAENRRSDRAGDMMSERQANGGTGTAKTTPPRPADAGTAPRSVARPPLPSRQPQQHIAPELRDDPKAADAAAPGAGTARSPEDARDRFTRYQRAWAAGKADGTDEASTSDDNQGGKA
ncbi:nitrate- and nitrite sensing domain-containing protein [Micromonospora sp. WMMD1102]|uniref:sensor histidine kinase n=1 Tax=Micromonospora sp. WMMD1102 TaxID=3016105 RepID=UPI002415891B|nr:nitrate- and nitrite sensing domain-containing protein [Micromonospora sp. WMMD1102]MDG4786075.1 nitrate- and nitrite sensing domain-containing protein [Micromonospora sp. WMMD1102]